MAAPNVDEFTADGCNPAYEHTGLQTSNEPPDTGGPSGDDLTSTPSDYKRREVTDPVTHLPITIHDTTDQELERVPPPPAALQVQPGGEEARQKDSDMRHGQMEALVARETSGRWIDYEERERKARARAAVVAASVAGGGSLFFSIQWAVSASSRGILAVLNQLVAGAVACVFVALGTGLAVWNLSEAGPPEEEQRGQVAQGAGQRNPPDTVKPPESAAWLNSLMSSLWPIVNPALFTSVADMLEDSMQATLPKLVRGVRVADIGQGNESARILGIRWLEAGDAARDKHGMRGEEGDFANFEIAIAYRARPIGVSRGGLKKRSRNAHLLIEFWTVGGAMLPVWVEIKGFLATARVRAQLAPNPPFLSMATVTLLGLPKVTVSCVPIAKNFLNIMDLPFVNRYLQKSIDDAIGNYVAPRSLQLDLKTLLKGGEKMDTESTGIIVVRIVSATGFKDGDGAKRWIGNDRKRRGDPYVTVGWGKYGKGLWTTRIIEAEGSPTFDEMNVILVSPPDINAEENLQLQLWDSDRNTADDLLGKIEVPLKRIMSDEATTNKCQAREDEFRDHEGEPAPGTMKWEVGYFWKAPMEEYLRKVRSVEVENTKHQIEHEAERKLRESEGLDESGEVEQQKKEDLKERMDELIAGAPPNEERPSGILYIKIENIAGLAVEHTRESGVNEGEEEEEEGEDLPSPYCSIIINHQKVYKTRTKLKDSKPYFNASTERFIRDFRTTSIIISVRDHREHEADPILGVVVLPLHKVFATRSQLTESYPITGGIGYGRMKLSLCFRSVQLQLPPSLAGWTTGTLEVLSAVSASADIPKEITTDRLVFRTPYAKRKLFPDHSSSSKNAVKWTRKGHHDHPPRLAIFKRYSSCLLIQFRKYSVGPDMTTAFCTLWLKDVIDDQRMQLKLPIYKKDDYNMRYAVRNAVSGATVGQILGELELSVCFYPGLSGYHQSLANSDRNLSDVMEVLDAAEDAQEVEKPPKEIDASSSSSSSGEERRNEKEDDGKRDFGDELKEYKKNRKDLHRRHRGLMQWSAARKMAWAGKRLGQSGARLQGEVKEKFRHGYSQKGVGEKVEKEV